VVAGFAALACADCRPRRVVGIDPSARPAETRDQISRIARHTARLIGVERELRDEDILLDERHHAGT
jgi:1-aminocyclopropane-1-carboxylate deaminase